MLTRFATVSDAQEICELIINSIKSVCVSDHKNDISIITSWCSNKTVENVSNWIANKKNITLVAQSEEGSLIGIGQIAADGKLTLCYVSPETLKQGIGKTLLKKLEEEALLREIKEIHLQSTLTAIEFYKKNGYQKNGDPIIIDKKRYCYPMRKKLCN
jgi:N-acetylglutamate synthase-like GNAT family acetyltransferase